MKHKTMGKKLISEKELFNQGWRRYGDEENDLYYKLILDGSVFGLYDLSGNYKENGMFWIYAISKSEYDNITQLKELIEIMGLKINWDIVNRYGSSEIK